MIRLFLVAFALIVFGAEPACADPISALIIGAIGLTGTAATIGTALVNIALSIGLSFAAKALTGKGATGGSRGQQISLRIDTSAPRQVVLGETGTAGSLVYWQLSGENNDRLQMVVALADHECEGLLTDTIFVNGKKQSISGSNVSGFNNKFQIEFKSGTASQSVMSTVADHSGGRWTSNEVGKHVAYAMIQCFYDEKVFQSGIPQVVFGIKGAKLYDWRADSSNGGSGSQRWADSTTWAYSDNPIVALYNVLRGIAPGGVPLIGMRVPAAALRLDDFTAAANACDETISLAGGGTEKRYRIGAVFDTTMTNQDIIETILSCCAGSLIESCGVYRPIVGVAQTSVASLTDADIIVDQPFLSDPKRPRSELTNAVLGSYADQTRQWNAVPLPPRTSSEDEATDGGNRLAQTLDLTAVTSRTQAQRIMEITRKRARRQLIVQFTVRARWFVLEPGDWVTLNSDRRGYTDRVFVVASIKVRPDLTSELVLRETDAGIDDWSTSDEIADNQAVDLASAGPSLSSVSGIVLIAVPFQGDDQAQRPGLQIQWDAITDPTVTGLLLEYRKTGDTVALQRTIIDASAGAYTWVDGIQGNVSYEARLMPATSPARAVEWSSWVTSTEVSDPMVVDKASLALAVPPDTITPAMLDAQSRFELSLITARSSLEASVASQLDDAYRWAKQAAETALSGRLQAYDAQARVTQETTERADGDTALAQLVQTAVTWINENAATVTEVIESLNGVSARWGVSVSVVSGRTVVNGLVQLDGDEDESTFIIGADKFALVDVNVNGGDPVQVITVAEDEDHPGTYRMQLNGELIAEAIKAGTVEVESLKALSSNFADMTCSGIQRSANGKMVIDWDNGQSWIDS